MPQLRWNSPFVQNALAGLVLGLTAGIYVALSTLGAGGGPAFFSGLISSPLLNRFGPAICSSVGAAGYIIYTGSLWYFAKTGRLGFPVAAAVIMGLGCSIIQAAVGYVIMSYPEERHKGRYIMISQMLSFLCSMFSSIVPLAIDTNNLSASGVPPSVYITFIVLMALATILALFILPPEKVRRDDGSAIAIVPRASFLSNMKGLIKALMDVKLLLLVPGMLATEIHLVYLGSTNSYHNDARVRCLNGFVALLVALPINFFLSWMLDHTQWTRRVRGVIATSFIAVFLIGAYIAEICRTYKWNRHIAGPNMDWNDPGYAGVLILYIINWVACSLVLNLVMWFLGTLSNDPEKCAHYSGLTRALLGLGQGIIFGLDAADIPYKDEAGALLALYSTAMIGMLLSALFIVPETKYFEEEHVIIPKYVQE
ncbi:hypothetical protein B7463_g4648, partial [Scytalidium lignicola]